MNRYLIETNGTIYNYNGSLHGAKIRARKEAIKGHLVVIYQLFGEAGQPMETVRACDNYERLLDNSFWYSNKKWRNYSY